MERFADELDLAQFRSEQMIESAIAAIRSRGSDGRGRSQCTDCGADIPAERLSLVPNAIRCTVCQEAFEFRAVAKCAH